MKKLWFINGIMIFGFAFSLLKTQTINVNAVTNEDRINNGLSFNSDNYYETTSNLKQMPKTFEAIFKLPSEKANARPGIIFGNFASANEACYSFELQYNSTDGVFPKLYYDVDNVGTTNPGVVMMEFKSVDIPTNQDVHLAITHDTNYITENNVQYTTARCYINGIEKGVIKTEVNNNIISYYNNFNYVPSNNGRVGGDLRTGNAQYFKGYIKSLELYSDVRNASEILQDYNKSITSVNSDTNLLASYNLTDIDSKFLLDRSNNNYNLDYSGDDLFQTDGLTFESENKYVVKKELEEEPITFEAEIMLPKSRSDRGGIILGNYGLGDSISFEINTNGNPRLFYNDSNCVIRSIVFNNCDVRSNSFVHLAITKDVVNNSVSCYLNGQLKQTISSMAFDYSQNVLNAKFVVGGDHRSGNEQFFKGAIKSVAAYSDIRTINEIINDMNNGVSSSDENLILSYEFTKESKAQNNLDLSTNGYVLHFETTWFRQKDSVGDYDYAFAVVGDTQILNRSYQDKFIKLYDWIVDNVEEKKIEFVMGLGDITDTNATYEWEMARQQLARLDGLVNYSVVRGNHDSTDKFNYYMASDNYYYQFAGFYDDSYIDNAYQEFTLGNTNYLLFTLDYGANDDILSWAGSVIDEYPEHKVIITTHCYMYRDGTTLGANDVCPPADSNDSNNAPNNVYNNGDQMWDEFVSQYGNIELVLSGHDPCDNVVVRQEEGIHGNVVTQMLIDPQGMDAGMGGTGMVAMLYVSEERNEIEVEFYSTDREEYFKESNQFKIDISGVGNNAHNSYADFDDTYHWYLCDDCEYETGKYVHTWDQGKVIKEPTYDQEGTKEFKCTGCDATYTEAIDKLVDNNITPQNNVLPIVLISLGGGVVLIGGLLILFLKLRKK